MEHLLFVYHLVLAAVLFSIENALEMYFTKIRVVWAYEKS